MTDEIRTRLQSAFDPHELEVVDDSESHRGHAGFQEGGESHFNVRIRAAAFEVSLASLVTVRSIRR